jgi:hypothetical protein
MVLLLVVLCVGAAGCQTRVTRFSLLATERFDPAGERRLETGAAAVDGRFAALAVGVIPLSPRALAASNRMDVNWQLDAAIGRALAKSPGAVALADGVVYDTSFRVPILWDYRSCVVKGRPMVLVPARVPEEAQVARGDVAPVVVSR